jgi:hypothetical protein
MSAAEIEAGQLICRVELRAPWPAEFVTVRVIVSESGVQVEGERGGGRG